MDTEHWMPEIEENIRCTERAREEKQRRYAFKAVMRQVRLVQLNNFDVFAGIEVVSTDYIELCFNELIECIGKDDINVRLLTPDVCLDKAETFHLLATHRHEISS
ncbi:hypothetical protein LSAT2_020064 [Lamellibrachia satsuma]|nr:hypothetical protein LSAT2_020064 [Lamellibrachia satsuma]